MKEGSSLLEIIHWEPLEKGVSDFAKGHSFDDEVDWAVEKVQSLEVAVTERVASIYLNTYCRPGVLHICVSFHHKPTPKGSYYFSHIMGQKIKNK